MHSDSVYFLFYFSRTLNNNLETNAVTAGVTIKVMSGSYNSEWGTIGKPSISAELCQQLPSLKKLIQVEEKNGLRHIQSK